MGYDAGDSKSVKDAKRRAYHLNERLANGFSKICNDPDCRYVLATFLEQSNVFHTAFHSNPTDHAYNEGFRNGGLWWLNNALLQDKEIMGKIQADKELTEKAENNDRPNSDDTDSDTSSY